jgi:hypothetical protein
MSDDTNNSNAPEQPSAPTAPTEPKPVMYSQADVEAILAAHHEERAAAADADPVARFRSATAGKAKAKQAAPQQQGNSEISELVQLAKAQLAMSLAQMKPPAPPPPPKMMTAAEKLASADEAIWLRRGSPNQWSKEDRAALVTEHEQALHKQGFKGDAYAEAHARAASQIAQAARKALANVKIVPGGGPAYIQFDAHDFMGIKGRR